MRLSLPKIEKNLKFSSSLQINLFQQIILRKHKCKLDMINNQYLRILQEIHLESHHGQVLKSWRGKSPRITINKIIQQKIAEWLEQVHTKKKNLIYHLRINQKKEYQESQ